ncbi:hypothetical protein ACI2L1_37385 [Streptomyces sp. NPDC019531]|uniref:hypothetical protein n=1 Tax=Streptomyces sp. NPDC019531 TaxID=3365062 RepID=UPI00384CB4E0
MAEIKVHFKNDFGLASFEGVVAPNGATGYRQGVVDLVAVPVRPTRAVGLM